MTIFYCLRLRDTPNLEGQVLVFISSRNRVAQLYPQAMGSLFVISCDSQDYGGSIRTCLHMGFDYLIMAAGSRYIALARTAQKTPLPTVLLLLGDVAIHADHTKNTFCCLCSLCYADELFTVPKPSNISLISYKVTISFSYYKQMWKMKLKICYTVKPVMPLHGELQFLIHEVLYKPGYVIPSVGSLTEEISCVSTSEFLTTVWIPEVCWKCRCTLIPILDGV
jgi:hypothetical protein